MSHDIGVVILNYNGLFFLKQFLSDLVNNVPDYCTIYVIDNASTDASSTYVRETFPEIKLIQLVENYGYAGGYNKGLQQVDHTYLFLINSDLEIDKKCIDYLADYLEQHEDCAAVQPKILDYKNRGMFEYAGAAGGYIDILGYPFCRGRIFDTIEEDKQQYDTQKEIFWASGAAFFIRQSAFRKMEGFEESFFAHQEEIDLCWRLKNCGWKICCIPRAIVWHVGGGTLQYGSPKKTYLNFRNNLCMLLRNESISHLLWKFPLRLLLDGIAGITFGLKGQVAHILSIIKAHIYIYTHLLTIKKMRKRIKTRGNTIRILEKQNQSGKLAQPILLSYYLYNKKYFKDLQS